jgi:HEAT repeat protein
MADGALINQLLIDLHGSDRSKARHAAYRLAGLTDERARAGLIEALNHADNEIRAAVITHIGKPGNTWAIVPIASRLMDTSRHVRRAAIRALAAIGGEEVVQHVVAVLMGDENSYVRWEAAKALGTLGSERAIPELLEALSADENSYVRYASAESLGLIRSPAALDGLEYALLNDENEFVRFSSAVALGQIGDPVCMPSLIASLNTRNTHLWHAAAEAMWAMGDSAMEYVIEALLDKSPDIRQAALKAVLWLSVEFDDEAADRQDDELYTMWGWWN